MVVTILTGAATDSGPADGSLISVDVAISGLLLLFIWFKLMLADTLCADGVTSTFISSFGVVLIVVVDSRIKQSVLKIKAVF